MEGRRERKREIGYLQSAPQCGDQTHNPGMCHDQESDPQAFGVQKNAATN